MTARTRRQLAQIGSFLLAGLLLYLALRGVDFGAVRQALGEADYRWLPPLLGLVLFSHWLRAWRWQMLLEALPPDDADAPPLRVPMTTAFASVMIGYMVNYVAPRLGEAARSINLTSRTKLPFSGVFGTVIAERLLDTFVLALALVSVFVLLLGGSSAQATATQALFIDPVREQLGAVPVLLAIGIGTGVAVLVLVIFRNLLRKALTYELWHQRVRPVLASFKDGLASLLRTRRRVTLVLSTVAIWFCYALMAYLPFVMLGTAAPYGLTLLDGWIIMVLGSLGILVPSPGGAGSFHYITIQTLVLLFGMAHAAAATYAVLVHAVQLVLYVLVGALCLLLQGARYGDLRRAARTAR